MLLLVDLGNPLGVPPLTHLTQNLIHHRFDDLAFSPNLDDTEAAGLSLHYPWWELPEHAALAHRLGKFAAVAAE